MFNRRSSFYKATYSLVAVRSPKEYSCIVLPVDVAEATRLLQSREMTRWANSGLIRRNCSYSITSSARARSVAGIARASVLAVFRLMIVVSLSA